MEFLKAILAKVSGQKLGSSQIAWFSTIVFRSFICSFVKLLSKNSISGKVQLSTLHSGLVFDIKSQKQTYF